MRLNKRNIFMQCLSSSPQLINVSYLLVVGLMIVLLLNSCKKNDVSINDCELNCPSSFVDIRDNKEYQVIEIGCNCWMKENLNFREVGLCYDKMESNCEIYGTLYSWEELLENNEPNNELTIQGICPEGWHISTIYEWRELIDSLGGDYLAGIKLKSEENWRFPIEEEEPTMEKSGFDIQPSGEARGNDDFNSVEVKATFMTSTLNGSANKIWLVELGTYIGIDITETTETMIIQSDGSPRKRYSCRCVKN